MANAQTRRTVPERLQGLLTLRDNPMKTDSQLQQDVRTELLWEPSVDAAHIGVEVKDGVVTLAGKVTSFSQKWATEQAALRVAGVQALTVALTVILPGPNQRDDADIAQAARNVLEWTELLPAGAIQVMVQDGWVTLSGQVDWQFQRQASTDCIRHLMGVTGVSNHISLKPTAAEVKASSMQAQIEAALQRTAMADVKNISVTVRGSVATLTGTIHQWDERNKATYAAWGTPGIYNVVDQMTMAY